MAARADVVLHIAANVNKISAVCCDSQFRICPFLHCHVPASFLNMI